MGTFQIEGGHKLKGEITPQGAKNEVLQILCAVLLTPQEVIIENIQKLGVFSLGLNTEVSFIS